MLVVKRGEELHAVLNQHAIERALQGAWVEGIGGASGATLGFYHLETREYEWHTIDEPLEIVSLQGELAWVDGAPVWHIHGVFGRRDLSTIAGHVRSLTIGLTGELRITSHETRLSRSYDEASGLALLSDATS